MKTLLETLFDDKPGPSPTPHMWYGICGHCMIKVGPYQTWYTAREAARLEFTRINEGKFIDALLVEVYPI